MYLKSFFILPIFPPFIAAFAGCGSVPHTPEAPPTASVRASPAAQKQPPSPAVHAPDRSDAVFQVLLALGVDYRPGGRSHETGFDCSGLVQHVYREAFGVRLPP